MKKLTSTTFWLLAILPVFAQLPVSTVPQNKKVILEEYTGYSCTYCPDGHKRADQLSASNPGDVFVINIHTGAYAGNNPDYKTPFGASLANQSNLTGYPAGSVNRVVFPAYSQNTTNPGTAMSRGNWSNAASQILQQPSYLNVALQANLNVATRELTVNVEVYYTGNSPQSVNYLNIALVQDSIMGPQTGGSTYYPEMWNSSIGKYQHNKMLRHLITGQWGDQINTTTQGSLIARQYTYTIPEELPLSTSGVKTEVLLNKLRLIAFVTETTQQIVSGNTGPINLDNSSNVYDMTATSLSIPSTLDINNAPFTISGNIKNQSTVAVNSYTINYNVDGGATVSHNISSVNIPPNTTSGFNHPIPWSPANTGTYIIKAWASSINGLYLDMQNANDTVTATVVVENPLGIANPKVSGEFVVYPNPSKGIINIDFALETESGAHIQVLNSLGQEMLSENKDRLQQGRHVVSIDASNLPSGIYFIRLGTSKQQMLKRISILE